MSTVKNATGKNVYFTEQYTDVNGDFNGDLGWHMENVVTGSLNNWSKCVLEWNLATDASHGPHTPGGCTDCLGALTINNATSYDRNVSYYIIAHLSKFIQAGAKRIGVTTNSGKLFVSAFKNPDSTLAIVAFNYWGGVNDTETIQLVVGTQKIDYSISPRTAVTFVVNNSGTVGIKSVQEKSERKLIRVLDFMGRTTEFKLYTPLILQYSDGSSERVIQVK